MAEPNPHRGSALDDFLESEGVASEFQAQANKEFIAWQLAAAMKEVAPTAEIAPQTRHPILVRNSRRCTSVSSCAHSFVC